MKYQAPFGASDPDDPYVDRNTSTATRGSVPPAAAIEDPQRELVALIEAAGLTPDEDDLGQVAKAVQSGKLNHAVGGGTANAITAALTPALLAAVVGMKITVTIAAANTSTAVTLDAGPGAATVYRLTENALAVGDIAAGENTFMWDGTYWRLMTQAKVISGAPASRWTKLANGLIMQWGTATGTAGTYSTITFPVAFLTAVQAVVISDQSAPMTGSQMSVFGVANLTLSNFQMAGTRDFSTNVADSAFWIAMGY